MKGLLEATTVHARSTHVVAVLWPEAERFTEWAGAHRFRLVARAENDLGRASELLASTSRAASLRTVAAEQILFNGGNVEFSPLGHQGTRSRSI